MTRHDPDQEGKRSVPIRMSNPVFSKLIKLGQAAKKTPPEMARELFEEAYAARCMGKGAPAAAAPIGDAAEAAHRDFKQLEAIAEDWRDKATKAAFELAEERGKLDALHAEIRAAAYEAWPAAEDVGEDAGHIIRELAGERDKAELELLRSKPVPVTIDPPEPGAGLGLAPLPEPAPPAIGKSTRNAVLAMHGLRATPAEIAAELALRREVVDQVLREARA